MTWSVVYTVMHEHKLSYMSYPLSMYYFRDIKMCLFILQGYGYGGYGGYGGGGGGAYTEDYNYSDDEDDDDDEEDEEDDEELDEEEEDAKN